MKTTCTDDFPFWLTAKQIRILPVSKELLPSAETALKRLKAAGLRASLDRCAVRLCTLIRSGEQIKISVIGTGVKEVESTSESVRTQRQSELSLVSLEWLIDAACQAKGARATSLPLTEGAAG